MPKEPASSCCSSVFTLANTTSGCASDAFSYTGAKPLHGPHHGAQKSIDHHRVVVDGLLEVFLREVDGGHGGPSQKRRGVYSRQSCTPAGSRLRRPGRCTSARWSPRSPAGSTRAPPADAGSCAWRTSTAPRVAPGAADDILRALARLGLRLGRRAVSTRASAASALSHAPSSGSEPHTYWCGCTRREIADSSLGLAADGAHIYPGTCRDGLRRGKRRARACAPSARDDRLRRPRAGPRRRRSSSATVGDFVLYRADGLVRLPARGRGGRRRAGHHRRRARRGPARFDGAPDLPATAPRLAHAALPARAGRGRCGRRKAFQADRRAAVDARPLATISRARCASSASREPDARARRCATGIRRSFPRAARAGISTRSERRRAPARAPRYSARLGRSPRNTIAAQHADHRDDRAC